MVSLSTCDIGNECVLGILRIVRIDNRRDSNRLPPSPLVLLLLLLLSGEPVLSTVGMYVLALPRAGSLGLGEWCFLFVLFVLSGDPIPCTSPPNNKFLVLTGAITTDTVVSCAWRWVRDLEDILLRDLGDMVINSKPT